MNIYYKNDLLIFPKVFDLKTGYKFSLCVFIQNKNGKLLVFASYFQAPSMVLARRSVSAWKYEFLKQNNIEDDSEFIYDLINLSLGERRLL